MIQNIKNIWKNYNIKRFIKAERQYIQALKNLTGESYIESSPKLIEFINKLPNNINYTQLNKELKVLSNDDLGYLADSFYTGRFRPHNAHLSSYLWKELIENRQNLEYNNFDPLEIQINYICCLYLGIGNTPRNRERAIQLLNDMIYNKSENDQNTVPYGIAKVLLANTIIKENKNYLNNHIDLKKAFDLYLDAANIGIPESYQGLGVMYYHGLGGIKKSYESAFKSFEIGSDLGEPNSCYYTAFMYGEGKGVRKDLIKANLWHKRALALGHPFALFSMGLRLRDGSQNIPQNIPYSEKFLIASADQGYWIAMNELLVLYKEKKLETVTLDELKGILNRHIEIPNFENALNRLKF